MQRPQPGAVCIAVASDAGLVEQLSGWWWLPREQPWCLSLPLFACRPGAHPQSRTLPHRCPCRTSSTPGTGGCRAGGCGCSCSRRMGRPPTLRSPHVSSIALRPWCCAAAASWEASASQWLCAWRALMRDGVVAVSCCAAKNGGHGGVRLRVCRAVAHGPTARVAFMACCFALIAHRQASAPLACSPPPQGGT